jgi:hypothetical protein
MSERVCVTKYNKNHDNGCGIYHLSFHQTYWDYDKSEPELLTGNVRASIDGPDWKMRREDVISFECFESTIKEYEKLFGMDWSKYYKEFDGIGKDGISCLVEVENWEKLILTFGKFKGKTFLEVANENPLYLRWCQDQMILSVIRKITRSTLTPFIRNYWTNKNETTNK